MNLTRKTMRRAAATCFASALMLSLTAVPALAEGNPGVTKGDSFQIEKDLQIPENTYTPDATFTFTISPANSLTEKEQNKGIELGVEGGVTATGTATFTADSSETVAPAGGKTVTASSSDFDVNIDVFEHAGIYKYEVTENADTTGDFKNDESTLTLYVHIVNGAEGLAVEYVELIEEDGTTKTDGFTNIYGQNGGEKDQLYDLTLQKLITGTAANLEGEFEFTVKVDSEYDNNKYLVVDANGNGTYGDEGDETYSLQDGEAQTISLGNEETAKIFGLTDGDTYTINETAGGQNGYETTVNGDEFEKGTYTVTGSISRDTTITYTNNRDASTPTGIAMTMAPYVLLVGAAGGASFLFLRRHRAE